MPRCAQGGISRCSRPPRPWSALRPCASGGGSSWRWPSTKRAGRRGAADRQPGQAVLAEQLGIDPGPELAALEGRSSGKTTHCWPVDRCPRWAPALPAGCCRSNWTIHEAFLGRDEDIRICLDILRDRSGLRGRSVRQWEVLPGPGRHCSSVARRSPLAELLCGNTAASGESVGSLSGLTSQLLPSRNSEQSGC